jgi:serine O-acetyltransferase
VATVYTWHAAPLSPAAVSGATEEALSERPIESAKEQPSSKEPDWSRERCSPFAWRPSRQLLRALRDYTRARERGGPVGALRRRFACLRHRFWSVVAGADIPVNAARIAGGLMIPHPTGVVVHPEAIIGPNCLIFQQVTIGTGPKPGVPRLGGHVDVGPGAKILGGVTIGDHAVIGANAVVLSDVPPGAVAVGVPAVTKRVTLLRRDSA